MFKEENILLPMCLQTLTANEWAEVWASSPRYGWCLVEPREGYRPPADFEVETEVRGGVQLPTGNLTIQQLTLMFSTLPVDVTFVDENDRVAFFSEGPDRVFARSKAIVGRKVQHCHPPKSVDTVNQILDDFRAGRQSVAEFWLEFHGRFVHVRYFAVRDAGGRLPGNARSDAGRDEDPRADRGAPPAAIRRRAGGRLTRQQGLEPGGNGRLEADALPVFVDGDEAVWVARGRRCRIPRRRGEPPAHASDSPELADSGREACRPERRGRPPKPEGRPGRRRFPRWRSR